MDETMSGEVMALNVIHKSNNKLKFLNRKNDFLTPMSKNHFYDREILACC